MLLGDKIHYSWSLDKVLIQLPTGCMTGLSGGNAAMFSMFFITVHSLKATCKYKGNYEE